jgi:hypothetical protein
VFNGVHVACLIKLVHGAVLYGINGDRHELWVFSTDLKKMEKNAAIDFVPSQPQRLERILAVSIMLVVGYGISFYPITAADASGTGGSLWRAKQSFEEFRKLLVTEAAALQVQLADRHE